MASGGGTRHTHLGLPASFANGGCARQTFGLGESYCLTHPCPPGEAQGILKLTTRYRVWGRTPASIKAHSEKDCVQQFALLGYFFWVHIHLRVQVLCSLKFTKRPTRTFWLKLVAIIHRIAPELWRKTTQPALDGSSAWWCWWWVGAGGAPPAVKPPTEAPDALRPFLDLLTKPLAYVTVEDLGDRWNTPEDARAQGPRDLEFQDGENNFNQASSRFTAMRLLQAFRAAKSMAQTQLHVGRTAATEPPGTAKGPLDSRGSWRRRPC